MKKGERRLWRLFDLDFEINIARQGIIASSGLVKVDLKKKCTDY